MLRTLRQRLIISHILPLLVIIPIVGIALIYVLETEVLLPDLERELVGHAKLISKLTQDRPDIWHSQAQAQAFVSDMSNYLAIRVMLLNSSGQLLASDDPADAGRLNKILGQPPLAEVLTGQTSVRTTYSQSLRAEIADVWLPVMDANRQLIGVVRLSHHVLTIQEQFARLRYLTAGVLVGGLLLGTVVGLTLATGLERPLRRITQAVLRLVSDRDLKPLPEQGPQELRLLAKAVNTLVERLRNLEQAQRQLLANLVHELGRPLGTLMVTVEALQGYIDRDDPTLRQELLAGMKDEVQRLGRLVDDLAHLQDQILGKLKLNRRPILLSEWLRRVLRPWQEAAQNQGLQWEDSVSPQLPVIETDPDRLGQALGNLLSNAIKYTPPGGAVSISADIENEAVWIRVSDTGPGIAPEDQSQIFTPFYRVRQTSNYQQGMGLGLSIARELIVAHSGKLELESQPGRGSRFTVWLPSCPRANDLTLEGGP